MLKPNEKITFSNTDIAPGKRQEDLPLITLENITVEPSTGTILETAWTKGKFAFKSRPFMEIVEEELEKAKQEKARQDELERIKQEKLRQEEIELDTKRNELETQKEALDTENEDWEEQYDEFNDMISEIEDRLLEIPDEIEEINDNPDGDYDEDAIEKVIDDRVSDYTSDLESFVSDFLGTDYFEWIVDNDLIDKNGLIEGVVESDGYGVSLSSYDGDVNEEVVDGRRYYIIRVS